MEQAQEKVSKVISKPFKIAVKQNSCTRDRNVHGRITGAIAYWQMISACVTLATVLLSLMFVMVVTIKLNQDPSEFGKILKDKPPAEIRDFLSLLWIVVIYFGMETGIQLWGSVRLLRSIHPGINVATALQYVKFWRSATIVFTTTNAIVIGCLLNLHCIGIALVAVRMMFLREVQLFKYTLDRKAATETAFINGRGLIQIVIPKK